MCVVKTQVLINIVSYCIVWYCIVSYCIDAIPNMSHGLGGRKEKMKERREGGRKKGRREGREEGKEEWRKEGKEEEGRKERSMYARSCVLRWFLFPAE